MNTQNLRTRRVFVVTTAIAGTIFAVLLVAYMFPAAPPATTKDHDNPTLPSAPKADDTSGRPAFLTVVTCYAGMAPGSVEQSITNRVERWLGQLPGVASVESRSIAGVSIVRLTLQSGTDPALALGGANSLSLAVLPNLPPGCEAPLMQVGDPGTTRVLGFVVIRASASDEVRLTDFAKLSVRPSLARRPGVLAPVVVGGKEREVGVYIDPTKLGARGLTTADVWRALDEANAATTPGTIRLGDTQLFLDSRAVGNSPQDWGDIPIQSGPGGIVLLRDVGIPQDVAAAASFVRMNGHRAVCVPLFASGTAVPAADEIRKASALLESGLPQGAELAFMPCGGRDGGTTEITVYLRAPSGTRLEATEKRVAAVERFLEGEIPAAEREWIASEVGVRADSSALYTRNAGPQDATIRVRLGAKRSQTATEYAARLRERFGKEQAFADLAARFRAGPVTFSAMGHDPAELGVRIRGGKAESRAEVAERIRWVVTAVAGVSDAQIVQRQDAAHLMVHVDRQKAAALGLSASDVLRQVAEATNSGGSRSRLDWIDPKTGESYHVAVRPPEDPGQTLEDLLGTPLKTAGKKAVPLSAVARIERAVGPVEIDRFNGQPVLDVLIGAGGKDIDAVAGEVGVILRKENAPAGVSLELHRFSQSTER